MYDRGGVWGVGVPVFGWGKPSWGSGRGVVLGMPAHLWAAPAFTLTLILALADPQPASPTSLGPPQPPIANRLCTPSPEQDSGTTPRLEQVRGWGEGALCPTGVST